VFKQGEIDSIGDRVALAEDPGDLPRLPVLPGNGFYSGLKRRAAKRRSFPSTTSWKRFLTSTLKQPA
jgi:hypothetical protein